MSTDVPLESTRAFTAHLIENTELTRPFWEAAKRDKLVMQHCDKCRTFVWYPRPLCPNCGSTELKWNEMSGEGKIYSFTIVRQALRNPFDFRGRLPLILALIDLDEGPKILSNVIDANIERISIGSKVSVVYFENPEGLTLPVFKLK
ncbi:MAG TPA: Zn-ribbon domain-containing OB-fold protein [Nitrososphaerales archaeon]|nr:Zn-ribbon domain-containing OB-fold protein [Nitrososphaerales archaeon]